MNIHTTKLNKQQPLRTLPDEVNLQLFDITR